MGMLKVNPALDRAANINALNGVYASPATAPAVGVGSQVHTDRINALNRVYANPSTIPVIEGRSITPNVKLPTEANFTARSSRLQSQTTRYGAAFGGIGSPLAAMGEAAFRQKVLTDADAKQASLSQSLGGRQTLREQALRSEYVQKYYGDNYLLYPSLPLESKETQQILHDFERVKASEAYSDKLGKAIDAYQAKPENRRDLYDREVAKGDIAAPSGYKSDALDRIRKKYGDERTVGDVKPYDDLTPDHSNLKPDIVFHPDGTITYEKPDPNSSNIPLVLAPSQQGSPTDNQTPILDPNGDYIYQLIISGIDDGTNPPFTRTAIGFGVSTQLSRTQRLPENYWVDLYVNLPGGSSRTDAAIRPSFSVSSQRIRRDNGAPAPLPNDTPTREAQPIPTKPDGTADLRPFNPTVPSPVNSPSPSRASDLLPMRSPQNSPLGNLGSPEQGLQPLLDKLADLANATPAGQPSPFPIDPPSLGRLLDPRVPSSGVGENNPVRATSANLTGSPIVSAPETKPPMVSVPTTSNPTKIDNITAVKAKDQLATTPKIEPQTEQKKARQCEDPCIQGLHDKADVNAKQVEIKVRIFKACKANATGNTENNATSNTATDASRVDFEEKTFKVPASESDAYKLLYARIFALESLQCDDATAIATVPEWWALRRGSDVPQLAILFAEVLGTGKLTTSRWTLHVPHYNKPKGYKPSIPSYTKGNWSSVLKLNDGSRIVVNASTKTEAQKVTNKLKILVPVSLRSNKAGKAIKARIVENQEAPLKEVKVIPIRADFYAKGQLSGKPDWVITLRKK